MRENAIDADAFNAFEARVWEQQAPGYDGFFGQITGRLVEPLLDAAVVDPGAPRKLSGGGPRRI